jgi:hypothetical protein
MNYYNELLESYLSTKSLIDITNFLFEQQLNESAGQIDVQGNSPQERVNHIVTNTPQAATSKNPAIASYGGKTFQVWVTQKKTIALRSGPNTYNLTDNPQNAYPLFDDGSSTDQGTAAPDENLNNNAQPSPEDQKAMMQASLWGAEDFFKDTGFTKISKLLNSYKGGKIDLSKVNATIVWRYLRNNLGVSDEEVMSQLWEKIGSTNASRLLEGFRRAFSGSDENGSIAKKIFTPVEIRTEKGRYVFAQGEQDINLIEQANNKIKKIIEDVKKSISKGASIDQEKCEKIKKTIVAEKSQHLRIQLAQNNSILIRDNNNTTRKLINSILETANCGLGEQEVATGGLRQVRGEFFEAVQKLVVDTMECIGTKENRVNLNNCSSKLLQSFEEQFKKKKKSLIEALQAYEDAEDVSLVDDRQSAEAQNIVLMQLSSLYGKDGVSEKILRSVISMAARNYNRRKPVKVVSIAKDTRFGKKGDLLELWNSPEECAQALKIPSMDVERYVKEGYIRKCDDEACADGEYWGVDVSLKCYIEARGGVGLGSVSENTLRGLFRGEGCIHKGKACVDNPEEIFKLRKGMALFFDAPWMTEDNSPEYQDLQKVQREIDLLEEKIDSTPLIATTKSILNADNKIKVEPFKDYCKNLLDLIDKKFNYKEKVQSEFREQLEEYLDTPKFKIADPVAREIQMRSMIKTYMTGVLMENKLNSKDKTIRQAAVNHLVMSEFAAGGSRNPITNISIAGIVDNYNIDCKQNDLLLSLKDIRTNPFNKKGELKIGYNVDKNETTYFDDAGNEVYGSSISASSKKGTKRRDSFIPPYTLRKFEKL